MDFHFGSWHLFFCPPIQKKNVLGTPAQGYPGNIYSHIAATDNNNTVADIKVLAT